MIWDSISTLNFYMTQGSTLTGAVVDDESYAGEGGDGMANLMIDADSKWIVTGDSVVTNLANEGAIVDEAGNAVRVVGRDGTVYVQGDSGVYGDGIELCDELRLERRGYDVRMGRQPDANVKETNTQMMRI